MQTDFQAVLRRFGVLLFCDMYGNQRFQPYMPQNIRPRGSVATEIGEKRIPSCSSPKADVDGSKTESGGWRNFGKICGVEERRSDVNAFVQKDGYLRPRGSVATEIGETQIPSCSSSKANVDGSNTESRRWYNFGKSCQVKERKIDVNEIVRKNGSIFAPPTSSCERYLPRMSRSEAFP